MLVQVITGTTRQARFSERVATWVEGELRDRTDFEIEIVDLRDHALPFFEGVAPARRGRDYPNDEVARFGQNFDCDGFVVLTAEYNHGYPAVLKGNGLDLRRVARNRSPRRLGHVGGAAIATPRSRSSSRWHRCGTPCTSLPDVMIPILRNTEDLSDLRRWPRFVRARLAGGRPALVDGRAECGANPRRRVTVPLSILDLATIGRGETAARADGSVALARARKRRVTGGSGTRAPQHRKRPIIGDERRDRPRRGAHHVDLPLPAASCCRTTHHC